VAPDLVWPHTRAVRSNALPRGTTCTKSMIAFFAAEKRKTPVSELETHLNRRLLKQAMIEQGMSPLDGEVENYYRLLTVDTVMTTVRRKARPAGGGGNRRWRVEADFVSYQTVRKHLNECLDKDTSERVHAEARERPQKHREASGRLRNVVEKSVGRLTEHGVIQNRLAWGHRLSESHLWRVRTYLRDCHAVPTTQVPMWH